MFPLFKDCIPFVGVGADAEDAAKVVDNEGCIGARFGERDNFGQLGVVTPDIEAELHFSECSNPFLEVFGQEQMRRRIET